MRCVQCDLEVDEKKVHTGPDKCDNYYDGCHCQCVAQAEAYRKHVFTIETLYHMEVLLQDGPMRRVETHRQLGAAMVFFQQQEEKLFGKRRK